MADGAIYQSLASIVAPNLVIIAKNSGKLVAIMAESSSVTGCPLASPMTRKLMAVR